MFINCGYVCIYINATFINIMKCNLVTMHEKRWETPVRIREILVMNMLFHNITTVWYLQILDYSFISWVLTEYSCALLFRRALLSHLAHYVTQSNYFPYRRLQTNKSYNWIKFIHMGNESIEKLQKQIKTKIEFKINKKNEQHNCK